MQKNRIVLLALKALLMELSLHPKPGLVDPLDNGSHSDMDYLTFLDSCFALAPGFDRYFDAGLYHQGTAPQLFDMIRSIGIENEKAMFKATVDINTHKGANFLFGIVLAALAYFELPDLLSLRQGIKDMTAGLVDRELRSLTEYKTHGEKIFERYRYTGIRGEAEAGLPCVFELALPILMEEESDFSYRLKKALLALIAVNDDANMLKRGGMSGLEYGKELAGMPYEDIDSHLETMNSRFKERNLSPGGSADLLALTIFLYYYQKEYDEISETAISSV